MKAFPIVGRPQVLSIFDSIVNLYNADQIKILEATQRATLTTLPHFTISATSPISDQISHVQRLVERIPNNSGRDLLIVILEELLQDLKNNGANGVTETSFYLCSRFTIDERLSICLKSDNRWWYDWSINNDHHSETISVSIRDRSITADDIVPNYILQYLQQSLDAFHRDHQLTALALISIALEGALRDALEVKGYTYTPGAPLNDVYEFKEMHISKDSSGFHVDFPDSKPLSCSTFLTEPGKSTPERVRIKRYEKDGRWRLEIRDADYLKDYWTSDNVITPGTGIVNIGGLGTALSVARGPASILHNSILPYDLDELFQIVRNNLIHLSGVNLSTNITSLGITLDDFSKDRSRVQDAIYSISRVVETFYTKKANGTL